MYRFAAFSWNSKDLAKAAVAQRLTRILLSTSTDWQRALETPGLIVFHAPQPRGACHAYILKRHAGVVLGRLFDDNLVEDCVPSDPTFDDKETDLLIDSRGRRLVEHYWGHYVAFLRTSNGDARFIIRDPTGGLLCFLTNAAGIDVILSDMEDFVRLKLAHFSVDWDHLAAFFLHSRLITSTTGFREVSQLHAGECAAIRDDAETTRMTRSFYWSPADVYQADTIEDPDEARAALRGVIRHCVEAWSSCYDSIVHRLSGGLDSSIVAACLANASVHSNVLCFHFFTETPEGDERSYARAAAQRAGYEIVERMVRASEGTLESQLNPARLATPAAQGFLPASELLKQRLVTERRAGAVFSGQGGDHLFQQGRTKLIAAEYAHRHGIRPQLLTVVKDASRFTNESIWSVFGAVVGYGLLGRSFDPYMIFEAPAILTDEARASISPHAYRHPWVENAGRLPASKIQQVFFVVDCQTFYLQFCPNAEQIHPLISQPIIEHCLRIPTYVLAHRGRARGLVREAFEADVPAKIINRQSKGGTTGYFNRLLIENASFLRTFLLDGVLASEGLLDRHELEKQLSQRELIRGTELQSILNAARAEAWLSNWADVRQRTAA
jgi:asparagine synthase (glutamine-hydrolysing)